MKETLNEINNGLAYHFLEKATPEKTAKLNFASIKGGVGKTSLVIIKMADCLAQAGMKVVMADCDLNNSLSYHYKGGAA